MSSALDVPRQHATMLMPTDAAFEIFFVEMNSSAEVLMTYNETLQDLLLYHVVNETRTHYEFLPDTVCAYKQANASVCVCG